jgi:hypothetical protein
MSPVFDVAAFFAEYEEAMHAGDPERSRRLYADTFVASSPGGLIAGTNDDAFAAMVAQGMARYRELGMTVMRVQQASASWLGDTQCVVTVHWHSEWERAGAIDFEVSYLLRGLPDEPRIFGWVSHEDEQVVMRERGILPADAGGAS